MPGEIVIRGWRETAINDSGRSSWALDAAWLLVVGVLSSAWCITAGWRLGATFDEPVYLEQGLESWRTGSHRGLMRLGTMPLPPDLQTLPLYLAERWTGRQWDPQADWEQLLPWFRAANLLFWWLLLGHGYLAGRIVAGPWGGRLAVAWLGCEPNLLAHAALAATDLPVTACILALTVHFILGRDRSWWPRVGAPMIWFALAVLAKASGLIFGPLCLLAVELERLSRQPSTRGSRAGASGLEGNGSWRERLGAWWLALQPLRRDAWPIFGGGLLLVFLVCGCDFQPENTFVAWAHSLPEGANRGVMVWLSEHLCLFSNAGEGLVQQVKHNLRGHTTYLLGESSQRALWYYFPTLLTIKTPLPTLALLAALLILRPRTLVNPFLAAAGALLLFSLTCRVQIGIRLVLPLVALLCVGLAGALARTLTEIPERKFPRWRVGLGGWPLRLAVGAGLLWMLAGTVRIWPHGICYVNEAWGGPRDGYRLVSDSNYDWGQGIPELDAWARRHQQASLDIWYFGTDPTLPRRPLHPLPLHSLSIDNPAELTTRRHSPYLAVATTLLYGFCFTEEHRKAADWLHRQKPVGRTTTFVIFDLGDPHAGGPSPREKGS